MDGLTISSEQFRATFLQIQAKIADSRAPSTSLPMDQFVISSQARSMQESAESSKEMDDPLEDELSLSSEDRLKMELIKQLFGDEESGDISERLRKITDLMKQNQEAAASAQNADPASIRLQADHAEAQRLSIQIEQKDGSKISIEFTRLEIESVTVQSGDQPPASDPLVLDLDGDGIELTDIANGVLFDINGDGKKEQTAFVARDDGFLAMDRDLNGLIESGLELFGDQKGAANGFAELARYDDNQDRKISDADSIFEKLLVYRELNNDGVGSGSELSSLKDFGISAISLTYQNVDLRSAENRITQISQYQKQNGENFLAGDAWMNYRA